TEPAKQSLLLSVFAVDLSKGHWTRQVEPISTVVAAGDSLTMGCRISRRRTAQDMLLPLTASNLDGPETAQTEIPFLQVEMDRPFASSAEQGTKVEIEAQRDGIRAGATKAKTEATLREYLRSLFTMGNSVGSGASLRAYFRNDYKGGGVFKHDAYEHDPDEWCWIHKSSGIKVWQDALDLTQSGGSGEVHCYFHYTTQVGFRNITAPQKKAVEVFASLVTEGPTANAWWGQGVYSVRRAPHEWPDVATLVDNNFRNMHRRDVASKGRETADKEYTARVAYCIPILVNAAKCFDVSTQQTPEMQTEGKPPGVNLAGKLLNEPEQPERQCIVIRLQSEEQVGHASAVLLDTLRCRADATARRLGPEHDKALLALSRLADVLEARGAFAEAEPLRRRVLEATERQLGPEHRWTLEAVNNLGLVLKRLGKFSEAEALYRRDLAGSEAHLGANHPDTLISMNNLAALLEQQGKLAEAEALHRRALAAREAHLGANHPHTLFSMNNLAALLWKQGKLDEAEELQRKALAGHEAQLGASHPHTLISVNVLALILESQGKLEEAEGLHRRALEGGESQLGAQHPDTLVSVHNWALVLEKQGKLEEAEELYRRALTGREDQLGPMHPDTLQSVWNLAKLLEAKGSFAEAEQLYLRELRGMEEMHGPEHEETRASRRNLERFHCQALHLSA
ncbi:unnamed protein product, partial [Cladocopium goreaui]